MLLASPPEPAQQLREKYKEQVIFASIDRLDELSGLAQKFRAWREFLLSYPQYQGKAVLVQQVYYSQGIGWKFNRTDGDAITHREDSGVPAPSLGMVVQAAEQMISDLMRLRDEVNAAFGSEVVVFIVGDIGRKSRQANLFLPFLPVVFPQALLAAADVIVDTSLKSGMNLMPFEYFLARAERPALLPAQVAADLRGCGTSDCEKLSVCENRPQPTFKRGVAIVSEFSGSTLVLGGALSVNPWNTRQIVEELHHAMRLTNSYAFVNETEDDAKNIEDHQLLCCESLINVTKFLFVCFSAREVHPQLGLHLVTLAD
jgi:trehalose-6-phosphate synthase